MASTHIKHVDPTHRRGGGKVHKTNEYIANKGKLVPRTKKTDAVAKREAGAAEKAAAKAQQKLQRLTLTQPL